MTDTLTLRATITEADHPLVGHDLIIRYAPDDDAVAIDVRVNGRWWPIELAPQITEVES